MYTVDLYLRVRLACHVDGLSQRELSSQPKPKTAEIPKNTCLTAGAMVDPVGPQEPPTLLLSA